MTKIILGPSKSYCHDAPTMIVKSRDGGFVTQDCVECGTPRALSFSELPEIKCEKCGRVLITGRDERKNYIYQCNNCHRNILLWDMVPHWSEYFEDHGFGLDTDYDEQGNRRF